MKKIATLAALVLGLAAVLSGCKKSNAAVGAVTGGVAAEEAAPADDTPVQHSTISPKAPKGCGSAYAVHYGQAYKTLREVEEYKPGLRDYYVRELNDNCNEYLLAGISERERKDWLKSHGTNEKYLHCMVPIFDEIGAAAKRTLPKYRPRNYTHQASGEESLIRNLIKDQLPDAKVLEAGVSTPSWMIEKLNNGIPRSRYKYGMAWVKSPKDDDGFCRIVYVNIIQDYSGGGTYGDSWARYAGIEPAGCK